MRSRLLVSIATLPFLLILGLVAAGAASAGGGCHSTGVPSEATSTVVKIEGCTYLPTITRVPVGTQVRFLNSDSAPHDVTGWGWGSFLQSGGGSYSHRFAVAGIYQYSCSLHPGMAGVVVVGPTDFALASDVQAAPVQPATAADAAPPIPVALAGGLGLVAGALGAGLLLRRREQADLG